MLRVLKISGVHQVVLLIEKREKDPEDEREKDTQDDGCGDRKIELKLLFFDRDISWESAEVDIFAPSVPEDTDEDESDPDADQEFWYIPHKKKKTGFV